MTRSQSNRDKSARIDWGNFVHNRLKNSTGLMEEIQHAGEEDTTQATLSTGDAQSYSSTSPSTANRFLPSQTYLEKERSGSILATTPRRRLADSDTGRNFSPSESETSEADNGHDALTGTWKSEPGSPGPRVATRAFRAPFGNQRVQSSEGKESSNNAEEQPKPEASPTSNDVTKEDDDEEEEEEDSWEDTFDGMYSA